jgi:hypothetical protein
MPTRKIERWGTKVVETMRAGLHFTVLAFGPATDSGNELGYGLTM